MKRVDLGLPDDARGHLGSSTCAAYGVDRHGGDDQEQATTDTAGLHSRPDQVDQPGANTAVKSG